MIREGQIVFTSVPPASIAARSFAGLIPSLAEVVVDVGNRGPRKFDIDIVVVLPLATVTRRH